MIFVKVFCLFFFIGSMFGKKLPDGVCVTKLVKGKFVSVGDCKKGDGSEIANLMKESLTKKQQHKCDVTYKKKCYRAVVYVLANVTLNNAESTCESMNGKPANIYDLKHYQLLLPYLRSVIPAGRTYIEIWTGMEYKNNQLLLSNGIPITIATEVWYPNFPISDTFRTNVGVRIRKYLESANQGMFNDPPSSSFHGVICEI
uniref:uncharacterized protein LOC120341307 isoform X2 n=1 Tax=Styela clava TaxID=7725 RepID=UPI00193A53D3|nr:uncharacterized protein LOC120341307 isoform X2 [Styela clava]